MKILHVITSLHTGGAEKLMVDLLPRLRDLGNEVDLLLFDGTRTPFYKELEKSGIKIHYLSIGGNVYNPLNYTEDLKSDSKNDLINNKYLVITKYCNLINEMVQKLSDKSKNDEINRAIDIYINKILTFQTTFVLNKR